VPFPVKPYRVLLPLLAPVLIWQGKRLKRDIPKLPEPSGERTGIIGSGPVLRLLITGDSSAAGVGVATQHQALSGQLTVQLSQQNTLDWALQAKSGADIESCIAFHQQQPSQQYDVIVIAIGVNDVTGRNNGALG